MKPRTFFLAVTSPFVLWAALSSVTPRWIESLPTDRPLGTIERAGLAGAEIGARAQPFAVLIGVGAAPLLTLLAAWLAKPELRGRAGLKGVLPWLGVCLAAMLGVLVVLLTETYGLSLPLLWCWSAAQAIVVAFAFRAQGALRESGVSRIPGAAVLVLGVVLQLFFIWPGALVLLLPLASGWKTAVSVEQGA